MIKKRKHTYAQKNIIHTVHELGTIVNNRNIKQVKNKKKILCKLYARNLKLGKLSKF